MHLQDVLSILGVQENKWIPSGPGRRRSPVLDHHHVALIVDDRASSINLVSICFFDFPNSSYITVPPEFT